MAVRSKYEDAWCKIHIFDMCKNWMLPICENQKEQHLGKCGEIRKTNTYRTKCEIAKKSVEKSTKGRMGVPWFVQGA